MTTTIQTIRRAAALGVFAAVLLAPGFASAHRLSGEVQFRVIGTPSNSSVSVGWNNRHSDHIDHTDETRHTDGVLTGYQLVIGPHDYPSRISNAVERRSWWLRCFLGSTTLKNLERLHARYPGPVPPPECSHAVAAAGTYSHTFSGLSLTPGTRYRVRRYEKLLSRPSVGDHDTFFYLGYTETLDFTTPGTSTPPPEPEPETPDRTGDAHGTGVAARTRDPEPGVTNDAGPGDPRPRSAVLHLRAPPDRRIRRQGRQHAPGRSARQ